MHAWHDINYVGTIMGLLTVTNKSIINVTWVCFMFSVNALSVTIWIVIYFN